MSALSLPLVAIPSFVQSYLALSLTLAALPLSRSLALLQESPSPSLSFLVHTLTVTFFLCLSFYVHI